MNRSRERSVTQTYHRLKCVDRSNGSETTGIFCSLAWCINVQLVHQRTSSAIVVVPLLQMTDATSTATLPEAQAALYKFVEQYQYVGLGNQTPVRDRPALSSNGNASSKR
jgi:UV DNA damage repair endonuclease